MINLDEKFMRAAICEAELAAKKGEVPVGAVIVKDEKIIAVGHNLRESTKNPLSHAETEVILAACKAFRTWRLNGCTMYVSLEPCPMCAGAIMQARLDKVVFGASDPAEGALGGRINLFAAYPHSPRIKKGVLESECSALLSNFFEKQRNDSLL